MNKTFVERVDTWSRMNVGQFPISKDLIAVNERLTAKNSFKFIYSILAKHQSASLPDEQKFDPYT